MHENFHEEHTSLGYPPMQIVRKEDGKLYLPDGTEVLPSIPIGSEEHHLRLFIEYERTFGRGNAKYVTHFGEGNPIEEQKYGEGFIEEYHDLAYRYGLIATRGSAKDVEIMIRELVAYRKRHPNLYEDAQNRA